MIKTAFYLETTADMVDNPQLRAVATRAAQIEAEQHGYTEFTGPFVTDGPIEGSKLLVWEVKTRG